MSYHIIDVLTEGVTGCLADIENDLWQSLVTPGEWEFSGFAGI